MHTKEVDFASRDKISWTTASAFSVFHVLAVVALFALLLSWSNFPFAYYTSGADVTIPEWLHAKMIGGYTPMVPAVGTLSIIAGAAVETVAPRVPLPTPEVVPPPVE